MLDWAKHLLTMGRETLISAKNSTIPKPMRKPLRWAIALGVLGTLAVMVIKKVNNFMNFVSKDKPADKPADKPDEQADKPADKPAADNKAIEQDGENVAANPADDLIVDQRALRFGDCYRDNGGRLRDNVNKRWVHEKDVDAYLESQQKKLSL